MRVPVLTRQVQEANTPNVAVQGGLTPSQAASMVSNQIGGIGELVSAGAKAYQEFQNQNDQVRVIDAQNRAAELKLRLQSNETDGYQNRKGVDVVGYNGNDGENFVDYYDKQYQDGLAEISQSLSNDRQRTLFGAYASKDALNFKSSVQGYYLKENDTYQRSVYSSAVDRFAMTINENPANFESVDEAREGMKASLGQLMKLEGKSASEAETQYLKTITGVHKTNINAFIESGSLQSALTYMGKYKNEMSLNDEFQMTQKIQQKVSDIKVEQAVNSVTTGTQEYSNPAFNAPPEVNAKLVEDLRSAPLSDLKNIKYNDQRLDAYTVAAGQQKNMEWASPILLGIRLAGERSNNSSVSPKGAVSIMQFMPATWGDFNKNGKRDIENPIDTIDAAYDFVDWISKKYKTRDPMVISAYYNGGHPAADAVIKGKQPPASETREYLDRMGKWLSEDFGKYAKAPSYSQEQARDAIWNNPNLTPKEKTQAQSSADRYFKNQEDAKKTRQNQAYDYLYKGIVGGQFAFEQIPASDIADLAPKQIAGLKGVSVQTYKKEAIKTDPTIFSMIMLNQEELFKGKPQSVLHQYADKLSTSDYRSVTKMYMDTNKKDISKVEKDRTFPIDNDVVTKAMKPYLNIMGITDTKNKNQLLHFNAVKADLMQTLKEVEAGNGGHLTLDQINRTVLKNVNTNVRVTTSGIFGGSESELNRMYSQVTKKDDILPDTLKKIKQQFKNQGRNPDKVNDSEYINAYYRMMRRGY
ncbi:transglycosylase SLT domain-containing protein [Acinetobacter puyangensis]|uniref:transglycosylase SLT domain-containing protein n=1 Tax=Acinetobacter puyangensis TaxID=1096779 RepID=UPI003A4DF478